MSWQPEEDITLTLHTFSIFSATRQTESFSH